MEVLVKQAPVALTGGIIKDALSVAIYNAVKPLYSDGEPQIHVEKLWQEAEDKSYFIDEILVPTVKGLRNSGIRSHQIEVRYFPNRESDEMNKEIDDMGCLLSNALFAIDIPSHINSYEDDQTLEKRDELITVKCFARDVSYKEQDKVLLFNATYSYRFRDAEPIDPLQLLELQNKLKENGGN